MAKNPVVKSFADVGTALAQHLADGVRHVTAAERSSWSRKPFVCGTYTGDGAVSKDISLGFQPTFVGVWTEYGAQGRDSNGTIIYESGGVAMPGHPCQTYDNYPSKRLVLEVISTGFRAYGGYGNGPRCNLLETTYYYIAFH